MGVASLTSGIGCNRIAAITPSDTVALASCAWLRVGAAGNLVLRGPNDAADVAIGVAAGEYVPVGGGVLVKAATTATGLVSFS